MDASKTVELILSPHTTHDIWDELHNDINPNDVILKISPTTSYRMRLIGPFISTQRIFVPPIIRSSFSNEKLVKIFNQDSVAVTEASEVILKLNLKGKLKEDAFSFINKGNNFGQRCAISNVLLKSGDSNFTLKVFPMNWTICQLLYSKGGENARISGLNARDIIIRKEYPRTNLPIQPQLQPASLFGYGHVSRTNAYINEYNSSWQNAPNCRPNFDVDIKEESLLTQPQIDYIMQRGLFDIPKILSDINKSKTGSYVYRKVSKYHMPKELNDVIFADMAKIEERKHIEKVEEDILELPISSFENAKRMRGSINCLEVE